MMSTVAAVCAQHKVELVATGEMGMLPVSAPTAEDPTAGQHLWQSIVMDKPVRYCAFCLVFPLPLLLPR